MDIRLPLFVDENTEVPEGVKKVLSGGTPRMSHPTIKRAID